jgi:hypothetical protein
MPVYEKNKYVRVIAVVQVHKVVPRDVRARLYLELVNMGILIYYKTGVTVIPGAILNIICYLMLKILKNN